MTKKKSKARQQEWEPTDGSMATWLFCPFGLIMPSAVPAKVAEKLAPKLDCGAEDVLQVRARDAAHLDRFRELYCPQLSETELTPKFDYDCRAYASRDDVALAVARIILDNRLHEDEAYCLRAARPATQPEGQPLSRRSERRLEPCLRPERQALAKHHHQPRIARS